MQIAGVPWDCALLLLALAIVPAWRGSIRMRQLLARPSVDRRARYRMYGSTIVAQWLAVGVVLWRAHARGWSAADLGLILGPAAALTLGVGVVLSLALASSQRFGIGRLVNTPEAHGAVTYQMMRKLMPQATAEIPFFAVLVATVGICEEFLYRGFVFAAFMRITRGSVGEALLCSALLFGVGHFYQGAPGLVSTTVLGLVFGAVRIWTGSLLPGVLAHAVTDLVAGVMGPRLIARAQARKAADRDDN